MKNSKCLTIFLTIICASISANAADEKGSEPKGKISQVSPEQKQGSTYYVAIGKKLELTASELEDTDCFDDSISDEISDPDGIKWVASAGVFANGNDKGSSITWTAPTSPSDSVTMKLQIKDKGEKDYTIQENTSHKEVDSITIKVVKPNKNSPAYVAIQCTSIDASHPYGKAREIMDSLGYDNMNIDWSGLRYKEKEGTVSYYDDCNIGHITTGGAEATLNQFGMKSSADRFASCSNNPAADAMRRNCTRQFETQWLIASSDGAWMTVLKRKYEINGGANGKYSEITLSNSQTMN